MKKSFENYFLVGWLAILEEKIIAMVEDCFYLPSLKRDVDRLVS